MHKPVGIMHHTDTLDSGGMERVAVNIANRLPRQRYASYLCTTRRDGVLADSVARHVGRLSLQRKTRFDVPALRRLVSFIRAHRVRILHAHGSALVVAALASAFRPYPALVWHDHYGLNAVHQRRAWLYRLFMRNADAIIAVTQPLVQWACSKLHAEPGRVWYIPNFVCSEASDARFTELPGTKGSRIVCVANFRPQKDHLNLLTAMSIVIRSIPEAHLLLIGSAIDSDYYRSVQQAIIRQDLTRNVSLLGERGDVGAIISSCNIGVLSSVSEGFPLVLLEYGLSGLPTVATAVGQCPEILNQGLDGILVPPSSPVALAQALITLLNCPEEQQNFGDLLRLGVRQRYGDSSIIRQICRVYEVVLAAKVAK
jgi:glycosyltransferase involved in cell wall biosynthesis